MMASRPTTAENDKSAEAAKIAAFKLHEAEVETQEEWDELMALQGLVVVDVYQVDEQGLMALQGPVVVDVYQVDHLLIAEKQEVINGSTRTCCR